MIEAGMVIAEAALGKVLASVVITSVKCAARGSMNIARGQRGLVKETLGLGNDTVAVLPNNENVGIAVALGRPEPSRTTVECAEKTIDFLAGTRRRQFQTPLLYEGDGSAIAFGAENSQVLSRQAAGFERFDVTRSEFDGYRSHSLGTPYHPTWKIDLGSQVDPENPQNFYMSTINGRSVKRRIWNLTDGSTVLRAKFDGDAPVQDFISIQSIPSFRSRNAKHRLVLAYGVQRYGTAAIPHLLGDKKIFREINQKATSSAWQAIIRVQFVKQGLPIFYLFDVSPIDVNEDRLKDWRLRPPAF